MSTKPIVTPEAVPLELEPAGIGSRFLALMIDWAIQAIAGFALLTGYVAASNAADVGEGLARAGFLLLGFLILFGYPVAQEALWRGRTVGKAALGLRVVTVEGAPVRFRHAAIRTLLGLVDFFLTSGAGAVISVLCTARNQRLGDLVAGTVVLRERTGLAPPTSVVFAVPYGLESYAATLDVAALTDADHRPVRAFLMRAPSLPAAVRYDLAATLAGALATRVRPPPPPGIQPESFLACIAAVYQRRHGSPSPPPVSPPPVSPPPATSSPVASPEPSPASSPQPAPVAGSPAPETDEPGSTPPRRVEEGGFSPMS